MRVRAIRTRVFREGEDLCTFVDSTLRRIPERSVVVITSKIAALAERRTDDPKDRERIIKEESELAIRTKYTWLTIKDGMVMASAGVDESNAAGRLIRLPKDSYVVAGEVRRHLMKKHGLAEVGVLVTDSRILPLRAGIVGVALGYAGFKGVRDYRGTPDIFGRLLKLSRTDVADSLAAAAVLQMGEGAEQQPLALITDARVEFTERTSRRELRIDPKEDLYRPLFEHLPPSGTL